MGLNTRGQLFKAAKAVILSGFFSGARLCSPLLLGAEPKGSVINGDGAAELGEPFRPSKINKLLAKVQAHEGVRDTDSELGMRTLAAEGMAPTEALTIGPAPLAERSLSPP